jgi:hypothetical protein
MHRVEFHVPRRGQQMRLIEHAQCGPALPEMTTPPFAKVDHARVTAMDLSDRLSQSIARLGHGDQMDMIGHQAVRQNLDLDGAATLCKKADVALIVLVTKERLLAAVATLGDVMGRAKCDNTC